MSDETATEKPELTEEEKAERKAKREERKKKRLAKAKAFEAAHAKSKAAHPDVWKGVDAIVGVVQKVPQEELAETTKLVTVVLRNKLRPGLKAKGREKVLARKERLEKQYAKTLHSLGEPIPDHLQKYLEDSPAAAPAKSAGGPAQN